MSGGAHDEAPIADVSDLGPAAASSSDQHRLLALWNDTARPLDTRRLVHELIADVASRQPDQVALRCGARAVTFHELVESIDGLVAGLRAHGVQRGDIVGIAMERGIDLVAAVLATMASGAAYLPLDPGYPRDRLGQMAAHAGAQLVVADEAGAALLGHLGLRLVTINDLRAMSAAGLSSPSPPTADDRAYVIYTSGSTGYPKGVEVEHRSLLNLFLALDEAIPLEHDSVWLAVTSLSFDISIVELLWTLTRSCECVISPPRHDRPATLDFSLFYFSSGNDAGYDLVLEGARWADTHRFRAVWTPERHFHEFGALFPNPAVLAAALATITETVELRAGSCVLPLHSPVRVAEEWAVVDRLSGGRVGISLARGWRPEDFVLGGSSVANGEAFEDQVQLLRQLWAGESVKMRAADGSTVDITTFPRPLRPRVPLWLTAAGRIETFRLAGRLGLNVLTHMLGQNLPELRAKVTAYRQAWVTAGHPGRGVVTLMMHTFVTREPGEIDATVTKALLEYLSSSLDLIGKDALQFPTFAGSRARLAQERLDTLSDADRAALLEHAADRIRSSAGLIGDVDSCLDILDEVAAVDVDELACLIDFGVEEATVFEHLANLEELRTRHERASRPGHATLGDLMIDAGVTHLQMTPSQVRIVLADESGRKALSQLQVLVLGGEAVPASVVTALRQAGVRTIIDMYGPTETTVWSTSSPLDHDGRHQIIGRPLANTTAHVLDDDLLPVPIGSSGHLWIGGIGVARGYLRSPELTEDAFRPDPFDAHGGGRMYRTGDLARWRDDGQLEYLGRADQQVKVAGHRIEPAEIEQALEQHADVAEAVVVAGKGADGSMALLAHVVATDGTTLDVEATRALLMRTLPKAMVPAIVVHDRLPHTANGKVDRALLARHRQVDLPPTGRDHAPTERGRELAEIELAIKDVWCRALDRDDVGVHENFLDLGGTSLLAVHVRRELEERLGRPVRMVLVFQHPTIAALARHLCDSPGTRPDTERVDVRRSGMERLRDRRSIRTS